MGLLRKMTSVGTVGTVDFRSDKERTARYTKQTRNEVRKQTRIMEAQASGTEAPAAAPSGGAAIVALFLVVVALAVVGVLIAVTAIITVPYRLAAHRSTPVEAALVRAFVSLARACRRAL